MYVNYTVYFVRKNRGQQYNNINYFFSHMTENYVLKYKSLDIEIRVVTVIDLH